MTKYYNGLMNWYGEKILFSAKVTDKEEERESWKKVVAADKMTQLAREHGAMKTNCFHAKDLIEVKKELTVTSQETLEMMNEAKTAFFKKQEETSGGNP